MCPTAFLVGTAGMSGAFNHRPVTGWRGKGKGEGGNLPPLDKSKDISQVPLVHLE